MAIGDNAYLKGSATETPEGFVNELTEDLIPGVPQDAGDAWINADSWLDDNPGQKKNTYPFGPAGPGGDGYGGVLDIPGDALGSETQSNHVSSNYRYDQGKPNSFPRGTGPDYQGQTLRGYVLNEGQPNVALDYEGPNKGPLYKPRIHAPGSLSGTEVPGDDVKPTAVGKAHVLMPDPLYQAPSQKTHRTDPTGGSSPHDD